ncbi:microfibril-associated glycoprotein 4-like [Littorina saxatilis]|uniref:microfibril-associated glycoprotein 4-like n=1 Tax=Littorina saxatilis TaxID=31220 RepID=UPI0038B62EA4
MLPTKFLLLWITLLPRSLLSHGLVFISNPVQSQLFASESYQETILFEKPARSLLDCARLCVLTPCCVTFNFTVMTSQLMCRGHSVNVTSEEAGVTNAAGKFGLVTRLQTVQQPPTCRALYDLCQEDRIYQLHLSHTNVSASCEAGWTVFHRRLNGQIEFFRNWANYSNGFGDVTGEYWLGLDAVHQMTSSGSHELSVDAEDWEGNTNTAIFSNFSVSSQDTNYTLNKVVFEGGELGDSLTYHGGAQFTTYDADNDLHGTNCAAGGGHGAWWYKSCFRSNLNGRYLGQVTNSTPVHCMSWYTFKVTHYYCLKAAQMKTRPMYD